jgi:hypothetical protein
MTLDTSVELGYQIVWDEDEHGWFLAQTGTELSAGLVHAEIRRHAVRSATMFNSLTRRVYASELPIQNWQNSLFAEIKDGRTANSIFGAGGIGNMTPESFARLEATLEREAGFLSDFAQGIADGSVSELQARARAKQYAQGMEASYWDEWKAPLTGPEFLHLPLLTNSPGDGGTRCYGNCQCVLLFTTEGIIWQLNPADHCDDCVALADGSPYRGA